MKGHALGKAAQAERARVGNEVDLVAATRELEAELGGDSPGSAVRRVTGDADSHRPGGGRGTGGREGNGRRILRATMSGDRVPSATPTPSPFPLPPSPPI